MSEDEKKIELIEAIDLFIGDIFPIDVTPAYLAAFLEATNHIDFPEEERLRRLAITIEQEEIIDGWKGLLKVYKAALDKNLKAVDVYHSIGISALEWCEDWRESDLSKRKLATADGKDAVANGLKIFPHEGDLSLVMGLLNYNEHSESETEKNLKTETAYQWFCRAVENNAKESARLYRAHCLHDLHRWEEAIVAYESVNQKLLAEQLHPWRVIKLKEQIAYCYAQAGQHEQALTLFHKFIDELLALDDEVRKDDVVNLQEMVEAVTKTLNNEYLIERTRKLIHLLDLTFLYKDKI